jgi:hypothetical protein
LCEEQTINIAHLEPQHACNSGICEAPRAASHLKCSICCVIASSVMSMSSAGYLKTIDAALTSGSERRKASRLLATRSWCVSSFISRSALIRSRRTVRSGSTAISLCSCWSTCSRDRRVLQRCEQAHLVSRGKRKSIAHISRLHFFCAKMYASRNTKVL